MIAHQVACAITLVFLLAFCILNFIVGDTLQRIIHGGEKRGVSAYLRVQQNLAQLGDRNVK